MKVAVTVYLSQSVYRALVWIAAKHDTQVHVLIERAMERAVKRRRPPQEARPARDEFDRQIVQLNAAGLSDNRISKQIGLTQSSVSKRRRDMGLQSPAPGGRR